VLQSQLPTALAGRLGASRKGGGARGACRALANGGSDGGGGGGDRKISGLGAHARKGGGQAAAAPAPK
jgi:hypothetical protein